MFAQMVPAMAGARAAARKMSTSKTFDFRTPLKFHCECDPPPHAAVDELSLQPAQAGGRAGAARSRLLHIANPPLSPPRVHPV
jgi:hypothetical protein